MKVNDRRREIAQLARSAGRVIAADLAQHFDVNAETIRRDLAALEASGDLHRTRGGAIAVTPLTPELHVDMRLEAADEKVAIAAEAASLIPHRGTIFVEAGSTTGLLVEHLFGRPDLVVVTNALELALGLVRRGVGDVMTIGGRVRRRSHAEVGPWAHDRLANLRFDVAFVGTNAIDLDWGISTPDPSEAHIKSAIIDAAERSVLMADHQKFGLRAACRYGVIEDVDIVVTDDQLDEQMAAEVISRDIQLRIAQSANQALNASHSTNQGHHMGGQP